MKTSVILLTFLGAAALFNRQSRAQTYDTNDVIVQTFAGYGIPAYVDGSGQFTAFSGPTQIVSDTASNLFVWDNNNYRIRKITPDGTVSTFAGGGNYFEGYGTNVSLSWSPAGAMAIDHANTLWLVMAANYGGNSYILSIGTNGYVTIANGGLTNLSSTSGICFDSANHLYYSGGNRIYRYTPATGIAQPFAGNGVSGNFDGQGPVFTAFSNPTALTCDQADNLYVWDSGNETIRRVDPSATVTTIAGSGGYYYSMADGTGTNASFSGIVTMFSDHTGNIYFVCSSCIRKMDAQTNVTTLAGNFYSSAFADGPGDLARFNNASGGCFSQGQIFIADTGNNRIRVITSSSQAQAVSPANLQLKTFPGLQISGTVGRTYQIESSPDMNTWSTVATLLLNSSPYLWIDQTPVSGKRFYRAVMLP